MTTRHVRDPFCGASPGLPSAADDVTAKDCILESEKLTQSRMSGKRLKMAGGGGTADVPAFCRSNAPCCGFSCNKLCLNLLSDECYA
jgi:hypothetical protein